jgi:hypothetical protein
MFISHKDNKIIAFSELEWECRLSTKNISIEDYWEWIKSVTTVTGTSPDLRETIDYSGEDYSVEEVDQDMDDFLASGHITSDIDGDYYHLKWDSSSKKVVGDDDAKDAWILSQEWKRIRTQRTRLLAETDWVVIKARENGGTVPAAWKTYRVALRDLPAEQSDKTKYSEITWPTKPS